MNAKRMRDMELLCRGVHWVRVNLPGQGNGVNATYAVEYPRTYLPISRELRGRFWNWL